MQVQLAGGKLRGGTDSSAENLSERARRELGTAVRIEDVKLPPYYPRDPVMLRMGSLARCRPIYRQARREVLRGWRRKAILNETLVIFMTDHGISHARGKQFLYDEGTQIPFVVRGPGITRGEVREDLIEHIDVAAISLAAAGIPIPR